MTYAERIGTEMACQAQNFGFESIIFEFIREYEIDAHRFLKNIYQEYARPTNFPIHIIKLSLKIFRGGSLPSFINLVIYKHHLWMGSKGIMVISFKRIYYKIYDSFFIQPYDI